MTPVRTERLVLRNWEERDRPLFHRINCDERVMEFFPIRRDRAQSDALLDKLRDFIDANGFGFSAVEIAATGECAGFAGLYRADYLEPFLPVDTIEIGWRLAPEYWGRGYATEAARAHLAYGFKNLGLTEIVSFAVSGNRRSTAVMERLGMLRDEAGDFDHPHVPDSHPRLKRHVLYRLPRQLWPDEERTAE
ncbi:MAG TPA: GNAT family N-acetyltransferase [Rhizobiaceae bacterium]|nr:GNAT family N-acetyltransferase [Rhizobiaceae bacterium]